MREDINNNNEMENEIDVQELLFSYLHYWWVIALCTIAFVGIALAWTNLFVTPMYRASVTVYVNNYVGTEKAESIDSGSLTTAQKLVETYVNIINSNTVLQKVVDEAKLGYTPKQLRGMVAAQQVDTTEIFLLYVVNSDPRLAARIANAIADVAPGEIATIVEGSSTKIVDYATVPSSPYTPNYRKNALIAAICGIVASMIYLTIRYLLDVHINDAEDLERMFQYPVLGQVPDITQMKAKRDHAYEIRSEERKKHEQRAKAHEEKQKKQEGKKKQNEQERGV